jgi:hypothetical protein
LSISLLLVVEVVLHVSAVVVVLVVFAQEPALL